MPNTTYHKPLDKLLELGEPDNFNQVDKWMNYVAEFNLSDEHVPDLIKMLQEYSQPMGDEEFDADNSANWSAIHAWRALGQLKAESALQPLMDVMLSDVWNDWGWDDLPNVLIMFGEQIIEPLKLELSKRASYYDRNPTLVQATLERLGEKQPDLQETIADIFIEQLKKAYTNDSTLNGFIIDTLVEWKIEKALPIIEKAFANGDVDTSIVGDWEEVQVEYGLKTEDEVDIAAKNALRRANLLRQMGANTIALDDFPKSSPKRPVTGKATKKKKRKQAQMQRKQNRKKKK